MSRAASIYTISVALLLGANLFSGYQVVRAFLAGQLPDSQLFLVLFQYFWLPSMVVAVAYGVVGAYDSMRRGNLESHALTLFAALQCVAFKVDQASLGWSALRLSIDLNLPRFSVGCNLIGVAVLAALFVARRIDRSYRSARAVSPAPAKTL